MGDLVPPRTRYGYAHLPPLPPPVLSVASVCDGIVNLSWSSVLDNIGTGIFMGTVSGQENLLSAQITAAQGATSIQVPSLQNGTTYYFVAKSLNSAGFGAPSSEVSATPVALGAPGSLSAVSSIGFVVLNWSAVPSAVSYNIYRSLVPNGEGGTPYATGVTGTTYTDTTIVPNTTYYYKVSATNSCSTVSAQSVEVNGSGMTLSAYVAALFSGYYHLDDSGVPTSGWDGTHPYCANSSTRGSPYLECHSTSADPRVVEFQQPGLLFGSSNKAILFPAPTQGDGRAIQGANLGLQNASGAPCMSFTMLVNLNARPDHSWGNNDDAFAWVYDSTSSDNYLVIGCANNSGSNQVSVPNSSFYVAVRPSGTGSFTTVVHSAVTLNLTQTYAIGGTVDQNGNLSLYVGYLNGGIFVFEQQVSSGMQTPITPTVNQSVYFFSPIGGAGSTGTIDEIAVEANQANYLVTAAEMQSIFEVSLTGMD